MNYSRHLLEIFILNVTIEYSYYIMMIHDVYFDQFYENSRRKLI